jgi:hypothetical protein
VLRQLKKLRLGAMTTLAWLGAMAALAWPCLARATCSRKREHGTL